MERGSVPWFSVFFRPNHESAAVALLQSPFLTPVVTIEQRSVLTNSFFLKEFVRPGWLATVSEFAILEKNLNAGKIAATLSRAGQIIQRKSIDQREQTQTIEETISNHGEHREHGKGEHTRHSQGGGGNHMGTDRIRRLRHGASACVRRLSAPGRLCWSQQAGS
jgi:hypothetical protein